MDYADAPAHYQRAYDRLETEQTTITGNTTTQCKPAVFEFPESADLSAEAVHEAVTTEECIATSPFLDETDDGFYYTSSRLYRPDAEPDIEIRADATTLRLFETPFDAEEPLPRLSFAEFATIIDRIETALDLTLRPYDEDDTDDG